MLTALLRHPLRKGGVVNAEGAVDVAVALLEGAQRGEPLLPARVASGVPGLRGHGPRVVGRRVRDKRLGEGSRSGCEARQAAPAFCKEGGLMAALYPRPT